MKTERMAKILYNLLQVGLLAGYNRAGYAF
jgi:hypothetical protein